MDLNVVYDSAISSLYWFGHNVRYMFYLVTPSETSYPTIQSVPRLVVEMFPFFILISVLENIVRFLSGRKLSRINDTVASISQGIFQDCLRIFELPWNSPYVWLLCFLAIDLGFYWAHRIAHEVNFIWAIHQAHHSAEDFTMPSALRQALLQPFTAWLTYWPLAMSGIPPPIFLAHLQLGELYMFWLHTEVVPKLGPLEYILNTPSHHRVHHGRNPKYIDKNYGGVFIFWDFLFGTFCEEDLDDPAVYGLVHPVQSYNPFYLQLHHWASIYRRMRDTDGLKNKLLVPIMGPGWDVGKPRLGHYHEIPEIERPVVIWDPPMNWLEKIYVLWHFPLIVIFYHELSLRNGVLTQFTVTCGIICLLFSITCMGFIMEKRWYAPIVECLRCLIFFGIEQVLWPVLESIDVFDVHRIMIIRSLRITFLFSAIICGLISLSRISRSVSSHLRTRSKSNVKTD